MLTDGRQVALGGSEMAFRITITDEAETQLKALSARDQRTIETAILARLGDQPTTPTKAIKRLRTNPVAEFELRVGDFRVLYNVVDDEVILLIVGHKVGNTLVVGGEEFHEHQNHPPEQPGGGPAGDAE
jgi:mRNA-degrading endonuclease RelE of RelBE toxin-antitoxin system